MKSFFRLLIHAYPNETLLDRHLDVSLNDMETIAERAFHNVTKLQTLELGRNRLDNFPTRTFVPLMDLRTFSAAHNRLPYIPVAVQGLRKVERLDLAGNLFDRLKEKPMSRAVMRSVDEVRITRTNLSTISPNDFDLFPYLRRLYLGGNRLSRVAPYAFRKDSRETASIKTNLMQRNEHLCTFLLVTFH